MEVNFKEACSQAFKTAAEFQAFVSAHGRPAYIARIAIKPDADWGEQIWWFSDDKRKLLEGILSASSPVELQWSDCEDANDSNRSGLKVLNLDQKKWPNLERRFSDSIPDQKLSKNEAVDLFWTCVENYVSRSLDHDLFGPEADISFTIQCWAESDNEKEENS